MGLCYIPVDMFLKFIATLFSALHLVICWSFWHYWYKLQYQILLHFIIIFLSVSIRLRNGDQFANRSQTLKNCCKTGESRESVNSAKMPQNGPGGDFTALVYCSRNSKEQCVLHEFMLHTSWPILKICSNTVFCITFSTMLVIWHYGIGVNCNVRVQYIITF